MKKALTLIYFILYEPKLLVESQLLISFREHYSKNIALAFRLKAIGFIGILLVYKKKGYLSSNEIIEIVEELREVDFRVSDKLLNLLLEG